MVYLEKMQQLFSEGRYKELKEFCKAQLSIRPENVDLLFFYASSLEALGEHEAAKNYFKKLFSITKDRLFLICESISDFAQGNREGALVELDEVAINEEDPNKLFYAFKIAVQNKEPELGSKALYKSFKCAPKITIEKLQEFFEGFKEASSERRQFFIALLTFLSKLSK